MSIQSEIERIDNNVQSTLSIIASAGVPVASDANSNDLPGAAAVLASMAGGVQKELLWENASPDSEFAAQDIVFGYDAAKNYTHALMEFKCWSGGSRSVFCLITSGMGSDVYGGSGSAVYGFAYRNISSTAFGTYSISECSLFKATSDWRTLNSYMIPVRIYGIKNNNT